MPRDSFQTKGFNNQIAEGKDSRDNQKNARRLGKLSEKDSDDVAESPAHIFETINRLFRHQPERLSIRSDNGKVGDKQHKERNTHRNPAQHSE